MVLPLLSLCNTYVITGVAGNLATTALTAAWSRVTHKRLEDLYLDAFEAAVRDALPYLNARAAPDGEMAIDRNQLRNVLQMNLGIDVNDVPLSQLQDQAFIEHAAVALADASALTIGGHTLTVDAYWQVLRNLLTRAAQSFKAAIIRDERAFRAAILDEVQGNRDLLKEVQGTLSRHHGVEVDLMLQVKEGIGDVVAELRASAFAWLEPASSFFAGYLDQAKPFNHGLPLVGRDDVLAALNAFAASPDEQVALLSGRGGIC
jgi:hypothetical protein